MADHALLAPSSASRWLACTPSARLEEGKQSSSVYADEGTLAHRLGELFIRYTIGLITENQYKLELVHIMDNSLYTEEMFDHAGDYARFVVEKFNEAKALVSDAQLYLEKKLTLGKYIPFSFGTSDASIVSDIKLTVIDLKYGKGVPVNAYENKQMMVYALGVLDDFENFYDIEIVEMIIYQPRLDSISSFEMSVAELKAWATEELAPRAQLAWDGKGEFHVGDHCRFCKVKNQCGALAEYNLELARHEFKDPALLTDAEMVNIFKRAAIFENWITGVKDFMKDQAINHDKKWDGLKLVEGKSSRQYVSDDLIAIKLLSVGFTDTEIYAKKLLGITAMTKAIGKKDFDTHLTNLIVKPPGAPALVDKDDPRAEINSLEAAINDFK